MTSFIKRMEFQDLLRWKFIRLLFSGSYLIYVFEAKYININTFARGEHFGSDLVMS